MLLELPTFGIGSFRIPQSKQLLRTFLCIRRGGWRPSRLKNVRGDVSSTNHELLSTNYSAELQNIMKHRLNYNRSRPPMNMNRHIIQRLPIPSGIIALLLVVGSVLSASAQETGETPPSVLTINEAVRIAVERNATIEQAQINRESAGAGLKSSFGAFLPTISASGGYTRYLTDGSTVIEGTVIPGNRPDDYYRGSVGASLLLFDGFSRTANYNAAQATYKAAEQTIENARREVTWQVRQGFLNALRAKQIVDERQVELETARELLGRIQGLVEGGTAVIGTQYSQEAEVANAEVALENARTDYLVSRSLLSSLMNYDPVKTFDVSETGLLEMIDSAGLVQRRGELGTVEQMLEQQIQNRPDILAARLRADAADARITAASSGYYPSLSTSIGWGWDKSGTVSSSDGTLSVNVQYTLFDGFQTPERVQLAKSEKLIANLDVRTLELQARSELQQALARLEGAERSILAASKAVRAAQQSRFAADERFKVGVGNYSDYLTASVQSLNARINQVNAIFSYWIALYQIEYLTGSR